MTLRAERPVRADEWWLVVVSDLGSAPSRLGEGGAWGVFSKEPVAVVCVGPGGTWARDLGGEPLDMECTCAAVDGLETVVAELQALQLAPILR